MIKPEFMIPIFFGPVLMLVSVDHLHLVSVISDFSVSRVFVITALRKKKNKNDHN
jgi:hypothetical protein